MAIKHENYQLFNHLQNTIMKNDHAYDGNDDLEYTTFSFPETMRSQQPTIIWLWATIFCYYDMSFGILGNNSIDISNVNYLSSKRQTQK